MVARVRDLDAQFFDRFPADAREHFPEWQHARGEGDGFARKFDAKLGGQIPSWSITRRALEVMADGIAPSLASPPKRARTAKRSTCC